MQGAGQGSGRSGGGDSLQHRDKYADSVTVTYRLLDSTKNFVFDTSISDYMYRFPIPATFLYLGNVGTAAKSILFNGSKKEGFDPGFHAFDVYKWKLESVPFFNTTRPYTELGYTLGSQTQQFIEVLHTQNIKPTWNVAFRYRLLNSPGFFMNQKTNHNNYNLSSWYQSNNKRYNNYFIVLANNLQSSENGGIKTDQDYLDDPNYTQRFNVPTKIGTDVPFGRDFFNSTIKTGNVYKELNLMLRQQYDFGRKDSLISDSTVIPLFYPKLRLEHTITVGKYSYFFKDDNPDSAFYTKYYRLPIGAINPLMERMDRWKSMKNDFSIYQFPDSKNGAQFLKAGIEYELLNGDFKFYSASLFNMNAHGEYRNVTKNKKWDLLAYGHLYLAGYNIGDYQGYISFQRFIGNKWGNLKMGFQNINRSPSFIYDRRSSFYLDAQKSFGKENSGHFFAAITNPLLRLQLGADYFLVKNYLYYSNYYQPKQEAALFNLLRINASKKFKISRYWNLYSDIYVQQKAGNSELHVPLLFTRNRFAFEGNFFKNLYIATGVEARYHTPYKADNYSPLLGQFTYQDSVTIKNLPEITLYLNFRIKTFKAYLRAENLNSLWYNQGALNFTHNNLAAPDYPYPGLNVRLGIYWTFVN